MPGWHIRILDFQGVIFLLGTCLDNVRKTVPLVHNITNCITVNDVTNILLAGSGICGVAVTLAIYAALDIRSAAQDLCAAVEVTLQP